MQGKGKQVNNREEETQQYKIMKRNQNTRKKNGDSKPKISENKDDGKEDIKNKKGLSKEINV